MSLRRSIVLAMLVSVGGLTASCGDSGGPGETSVTPPPVPVSIARTGGIAGVNQSIEIAPDGSWVYTDNKRNQTEKGTLGTDQRSRLFRLVGDPAFADQLSKAGRPDPNCADAFHYTISTGGETAEFEDCGDDTAPAVKSAIAAVTEATPF